MPFWFLNEQLATLPYLFLCNTKLWTILIFSEVENSYRYIDTTTWRGVPLLQRFNGLSLEAKFFRDEKLVVDIGLGNHLLWIVDTKMTIYKKKIKIKNLILKLCYARTPHLSKKYFISSKKLKSKVQKINTTRSYFLRHLKLD